MQNAKLLQIMLKTQLESRHFKFDMRVNVAGINKLFILSQSLLKMFPVRPSHKYYVPLVCQLILFQSGYILNVESNQNMESKTKNVEPKTEKCGVQNSIWSVDSQENHKNCCHQMSDFKTQMQQNPKFGWGSATDSAGRAYIAPQTPPSWI